MNTGLVLGFFSWRRGGPSSIKLIYVFFLYVLISKKANKTAQAEPGPKFFNQNKKREQNDGVKICEISIQKAFCVV